LGSYPTTGKVAKFVLSAPCVAVGFW